MRLSSVRELKQELLQPLIFEGGLQPQAVPPVSVPAERTSEVARIQPGIALGIAAGTTAGDYRLAVRIQHRDLLAGSRLAAIERAARNEVDIEYIGGLVKLSGDLATARRERPVSPGVSIGHYEITAGTLGAFVRVEGDDTPRVLSNNHVLADENRGAVGDEILQPGARDGGVPRHDRVAALERFVALDASKINDVDAAIAALDAEIDFNPEVEGIGAVQATAAPDEVEHVAKRGRTTGLTRGQISAIEVDGVVVRFSTGVLRFDGQIEISGAGGQAFSRGGDSGSLVVDPISRRGVGLLFAGSDQGGPDGVGVTYANPLAPVFDQLAVAGLW